MADGTGVPDEKVKDTAEEFENQSQLNANDAADAEYGWKANRKRTYDEFQDISLASARRSQGHLDDLNARTLNGLDTLLTLQTKVNEEHFAGINELRKTLANVQASVHRYTDDAEYVTRYDLSNPVTTGAGDTLRSAAYTPNRAVDVAAGGVGVSAEAVAAAVAKQVDATITPVLAVLQQIVQSLANMQAAIANVINQSQPKTPTA